MPTITDFKIVAEDSEPEYSGTIYLLTEKYSYLLNKNMKVYDFSIFKALSQALGGKLFPNMITDFGQCIETWKLEGRISESTRALSEIKMMEWAEFVRIRSFNCDDLFLYGGEDPANPDVDTEYRIKGDDDRIFTPGSSKGVPIKINKLEFRHSKNRADIDWIMEIMVGIDFELV